MCLAYRMEQLTPLRESENALSRVLFPSFHALSLSLSLLPLCFILPWCMCLNYKKTKPETG